MDVVIEAPTWVWFIEAKYRSDISTGTKTRPERDQVLRNIDVGSYYAGVRPFFFSLLILSTEKSPEGVKRIEEYRDLSVPKAKLKAHRLDALENVRGIGELKWSAIYEVLVHASEFAPREDERGYVARAVEWLRERGLAGDS